MLDWLLMHWPAIVDWFTRTFFISGAGWSAYRFWKERRARKARSLVEESKAEVEQETVGNKIVSSSITTLEASRVSMLASWQAERTSLRDTILFQEQQLERARIRDHERDLREAEKDRLIQELRDQVATLQERIRQQAAELTDIADRLCELQTKPQDEV